MNSKSTKFGLSRVWRAPVFIGATYRII